MNNTGRMNYAIIYNKSAWDGLMHLPHFVMQRTTWKYCMIWQEHNSKWKLKELGEIYWVANGQQINVQSVYPFHLLL